MVDFIISAEGAAEEKRAEGGERSVWLFERNLWRGPRSCSWAYLLQTIKIKQTSNSTTKLTANSLDHIYGQCGGL